MADRQQNFAAKSRRRFWRCRLTGISSKESAGIVGQFQLKGDSTTGRRCCPKSFHTNGQGRSSQSRCWLCNQTSALVEDQKGLQIETGTKVDRG